MQWWIEVIDPVMRRKVDVTVGLHSRMTGTDQRDTEDLLDARERVLNALRAAGFELSDLEAVDR